MLLIICLLINIVNCANGDPNIIFILTDDQDLLLNSMVSMTNTINLIGNHGKTFQNAFVNTPICCPSRSTILTGKFQHNTGVYNNSVEGNCSSQEWQKNHEPQSIAAILKNEKNYVNFYAGKYLNKYGYKETGGLKHIPKGYDWWIGLQGNSVYYNFTLSVNGTKKFSSDDYLTDIIAQYSLNFLNSRPRHIPFFMTIAPPACHAPFIPATRHQDRFKGVKALRTPSFNHSGTGKHWLVRMMPEYLPEDVTILDEIQQHRLETLLAVDEMVEVIMNKLEEQNILDNTYIIFSSDHGFHIGQFTQPWDKRQPYETDVRVPFIVRGPKIPKKSLETFPFSSVDIAPTILDLAGVLIPENMDGKSLIKKLFTKSNQSFKQVIFIEYSGEGDVKKIDSRCPWTDPNLNECTVDQWCKCQDSKNNTYSCIMDLTESQSFKFCEFYDDQHFIEAYNLTTDPYELKNVGVSLDSITIRKYSEVIKKFKECTGTACQKISI